VGADRRSGARWCVPPRVVDAPWRGCSCAFCQNQAADLLGHARLGNKVVPGGCIVAIAVCNGFKLWVRHKGAAEDERDARVARERLADLAAGTERLVSGAEKAAVGA